MANSFRRGGGRYQPRERPGFREGDNNGGDNGSSLVVPYTFEPAVFNAVGNPDLLLIDSQWVVNRTPPAQNTLRYFQTGDRNVIRWELMIRDESGGLDMPKVEIAEGFVPNSFADSSLDTRFARSLHLLPLVETDTAVGKLMGNEENLAVAQVPSETREIMAGGGDTANQALFRLGDDEGNISVTPITYSPGAGTPVISLGSVVIGTSASEKLLVGRKDAVAQIFTLFGGGEPAFEEFTSSGSFVVPTGVTQATIETWGGGGGGGGAEGGGGFQPGAGGGGGGGAYKRAVVAVTPGQTLTVTIGAGGPGDTNGSGTGTAGGTTSVVAPGPVTLCSAPGGAGGQSATQGVGSGGLRGLASGGVGDSGFDGGNGADGTGSGSGRTSGGGGGGAGDSENGSAASGRSGGDGGESGGGDGGSGGLGGSDDGNPGGTNSAGGGGARSGGTASGGAGARGFARISYTTAGTGTPTATDMHANTANTWGVILSPINAATPGALTLLIYATTTLYTLSSTAAIADAPTAVQTNWPQGGYAIGLVHLAGSDLRAYWAHPFEDTDTSTLSRSDGFKIVSTNQEGQEPQLLDVGLATVSHALKWREGIVATDSQSVMWHNGTKFNLGALEARIKLATRTISVLCLAVDHDRLFAFMQERAGFGATRVWWEEYIMEEDEWHQATAPVSVSANQTILPTSGQTAAYNEFDRSIGGITRRFYWYEQGENEGWRSISELPTTTQPYYWQNTSISEGAAIRKFATTGTLRSPEYTFVGFEGLMKTVSDIWFGGEFPATPNEDSSVKVTIASQTRSNMSFGGGISRTFYEQNDWKHHTARLPDNRDGFDRLQFEIEVNQGTGASRTTPLALPIKLGGFIFTDGAVMRPNEIQEA